LSRTLLLVAEKRNGGACSAAMKRVEAQTRFRDEKKSKRKEDKRGCEREKERRRKRETKRGDREHPGRVEERGGEGGCQRDLEGWLGCDAVGVGRDWLFASVKLSSTLPPTHVVRTFAPRVPPCTSHLALHADDEGSRRG